MSKPARGTKRLCPSCGARFYDLSRSPITCPVCQAAYQITAPGSSRRPERAQAEPAPKPEAEATDPPVMGPEVISLDEAEEAEESAVEDEEIVDLGDNDEDIPAGDDDDDTFLEDDEEGNDDVSDIVGEKPKEDS